MRFHRPDRSSPKPSAAAPPAADDRRGGLQCGLLAAGEGLHAGGAQALGDVVGQLGRAGGQAGRDARGRTGPAWLSDWRGLCCVIVVFPLPSVLC